jgi:hypothetical protein
MMCGAAWQAAQSALIAAAARSSCGRYSPVSTATGVSAACTVTFMDAITRPSPSRNGPGRGGHRGQRHGLRPRAERPDHIEATGERLDEIRAGVPARHAASLPVRAAFLTAACEQASVPSS